MPIKFDYSKLLGRMKEKGIDQKTLATKINNTPSTLSLKLNNKAYFKQSEIFKICKILSIEALEVSCYFYTLKV